MTFWESYCKEHFSEEEQRECLGTLVNRVLEQKHKELAKNILWPIKRWLDRWILGLMSSMIYT